MADGYAHSTALTLALSRVAGEGTELRFAWTTSWIPGCAENDGGYGARGDGGRGRAGEANALNQRLCKLPRHKRPEIINPLANPNEPERNRPLFGNRADHAAFGAAV